MTQWLRYENNLNIFRLGSPEKGPEFGVYLQQILGCFMGGRGSMMKTSLLLGGGESRMFHHQDKHRRLGLGIGNFTADQLFSLLREVDDGALAAPNHCLRCTMRFAGAC